MTDEVPVSDVLLEATEYLCKLGTNLKLRSENLKEKRIAKSKLKNTHAVQKAADKLLLLCELSKKSLENVEVGVKRILRVCAKDQGPIPVKPATFKREVEYYYIKDGPKKLRMSRKIHLDHYKSVQVKAARLPLSKQETYPVYFDCKLYRSRRRKESESRLEQISETIKGDRECSPSLYKDQEMSKNKERSLKDSSSPKKVITKEEKDEEPGKSSKEPQKLVSKSEKEFYNKSDKKENQRSKSDSKSKHCDSSEQKVYKETSKDKNFRTEDKKEKLSEQNGAVSSDKRDKEKSASKKKYARIAVDDSSDEQYSDKRGNSPDNVVDEDNSPKCTKDKDEQVVIVGDSDDEKPLEEKKSTSKAIDKDESKRQQKDSNNDQPLEAKKEFPPTESDDLSLELENKGHGSNDDVHKHKKRKLSCQSESSEKDKSDSQESKNCDTQTDKPLIKLVDLSKLLKPNALNQESKKKESITLPSDRKKDSESKRMDKKRQERKIMEEKYWDQKRKEVLAFKPKKFHIYICKLPEFTEDFLRNNKIKKITHKGEIVAQRHKTVRFEEAAKSLSDKEHDSSKDVSSESDSEKPKKIYKSSKNSSKLPTPDMNKVKSALLDDSDSDKDKNPVTSEAEKVKKTLLNDSDSDESSMEKCQPALIAETSKEIETKNNNVETTQDKVEKVKNTLLADSDSDGGNKEKCQPSPLAETSKEIDPNDNNVIAEGNRDVVSTCTTKKAIKSSLKRSDSSDKKSQSQSAVETSKEIETKNNNVETTQDKVEKVKNTLLADSDSDGGNKEKCQPSPLAQTSKEIDPNDNNVIAEGNHDVVSTCTTKKAIKSSLKRSDSSDKKSQSQSAVETSKEIETKNNNVETTQDKVEKVKNTLLADSDSDGGNKEKCQPSPLAETSKEIDPNDNNVIAEGNHDVVSTCTTKKAIKSSLKRSDSSDKKSQSQLAVETSKEIETKNNNVETTQDKVEKVKNTLLADSDSDGGNKEKCQPSPLAETSKEIDPNDNNVIAEGNRDVLSTSTTKKAKKSSLNRSDSSEEKSLSQSAAEASKEIDDSKANSSESNSGELNQNTETEEQKEPEKSEKNENSKATEKQESSSETSKNKDTTPVASDVEKPLEKSPITPSSKKKRKHMMESIHAKKMLLTYSSSSDTDDDKLKDAIKEIKTSLLEGSDEDIIEKVRENHRKKLLASSSSDDDDIPKIQKEKKCGDSNNDNDENTLKGGNDNSSRLDNEESNSVGKMGRSKTKPSSSSQNSDTQDTDKDIDGLTNLKNLTKSSRRRDSTSTNQEEDSSANTKSKRMPKVPAIKMADLLQAATESSGSGSGGEGEGLDDLPPMSLAGLNGGGSVDLGKEQLMVDSDASSTHNKSSDEARQDDESEDEDNPKSKRRKALAISSDSEGGGGRKGTRDRGKGSDFTESDEETGEKKTKRKKRETDSDASGRSSDSGGKKKRRRIKQVDDSDGSDSGSENEGRRHGRKNIRKVMGKDQLEEATKKAARQEKERVARIAERQKLYNNLQFDESGKPDEVVLDKVILDFDPETKEPIIAVDRGLVKKLKPHQANGIKFMWDACFESAKRIKKDKGSGCILAHCMGLGKTLQVVTLTHTLLAHSELTNVRRVLVVCPLSTVLNWVNEFNMWLKHTESDVEVDVYELSRYKQNSERAWQLQQWFTGGGVCVLGYEMFRNLSADNGKKFRKKMLQTFQQSLVSPGPDLVVCDEGHLLKNEKTSLSQSMNRVKTLRRIVLTGTPLQNNLKEYYCMVQFVKPNLLGKYNEYLNRFVNPITNGQYTDSTEQDIRVMKRRSHVLHKMLDGAVQRRDYGVLAPFLPPKHEYVLFITLSDVQVKLYQHYLDNYSRRPIAGKSGFLFPDFQSLQRIWTHPLVLKYNSERYEIMQQKKRDKEEEEDDSEGSLADFIDDDSTPDESTSEESSDDLSDASDDSRKKAKKKKAKKEKKHKTAPRRGTRANPVPLSLVEADPEEKPLMEAEEAKNENPTEWWIRLVEEEELEDMRNSHKLVLLFDILRQCDAIGDKLLVFSQSLYSLDLIEHFLGKVDEATQEGRVDEKLGNHVGSWSPGVDYFRLDGSTSCENRSLWCKHFNREDNPRARLFLISTRAGGLGINLVAANRVVIFDVSWNPSHDVQSIFRVYRFGQKKPCYVYRFLAMGTMEEKIYERQVTKQAISKRVIDEQQIDRHYAENDLAELYKFEPKPPEPRPLPPLPKDRLFAEMLREHDKQIYKYHEHDSLLENKEEETLTEEERKAAWEDFENEKNRPPPAPFPSVWPMHNGMAPNPLLAQQQQQLAYAAIVAMLRKDMPNVNEAQIRDMLPLIYNANPAMFGGYDYGLMQKMGEIYKYAPGLMNPMMNAMTGAAGAGGMGGTSALQYEPPWQRQQQQQQQMRLQQLMQHQNSMNAKYYAGGLGSRDPVAMAMQQQAAREIMLGESTGRGRPRGRPPLSRPPAAPADVVNLDSD